MSEETNKCLGSGGTRKSRMNFMEAASTSKPDLSKFQDRFKKLHQKRV